MGVVMGLAGIGLFVFFGWNARKLPDGLNVVLFWCLFIGIPVLVFAARASLGA